MDDFYYYEPEVKINKPVSPRQILVTTPEEIAGGITNELKVAARRYLCPNCGKEFCLFQSRAIACKGCPQISKMCPYVRCPYCDREYPIKGFIVPDNNPGAKMDQVHMTSYAQSISDAWLDGVGENRR